MDDSLANSQYPYRISSSTHCIRQSFTWLRILQHAKIECTKRKTMLLFQNLSFGCLLSRESCWLDRISLRLLFHGLWSRLDQLIYTFRPSGQQSLCKDLKSRHMHWLVCRHGKACYCRHCTISRPASFFPCCSTIICSSTLRTLFAFPFWEVPCKPLSICCCIRFAWWCNTWFSTFWAFLLPVQQSIFPKTLLMLHFIDGSFEIFALGWRALRKRQRVRSQWDQLHLSSVWIPAWSRFTQATRWIRRDKLMTWNLGWSAIFALSEECVRVSHRILCRILQQQLSASLSYILSVRYEWASSWRFQWFY